MVLPLYRLRFGNTASTGAWLWYYRNASDMLREVDCLMHRGMVHRFTLDARQGRLLSLWRNVSSFDAVIWGRLELLRIRERVFF